MSLTGKKAPYFSSEAVINGSEIKSTFNLTQYIDKKMCCYFFIQKISQWLARQNCTRFRKKQAEFEKRDTVIIGCSTDAVETHLAWLNTPREKGGIAGVQFPIIADCSKVVAMNYEVLAGEYVHSNDANNWMFRGIPYAYRATFIIDKKGIIRHQSVNDFSLVRNIDEYIRLIDAQLQVEKQEKLNAGQSEQLLNQDAAKKEECFSSN